MLTRNLREGQVVRSRAGRDKGQYYIVVSLAVNRVMVANGHRDTMLKPKCKNIVHLWCTKEIADFTDDATIRETLAAYADEHA